MRLRILPLAMAAVLCVPALANEPGFKTFQFVMQAGVTGGGDELSTVQTDKGDDEMRAGGTWQLGAGVLIKSQTLPVEAQLTINYHGAGSDYKNGKTSYERWPVEALVFYTGVEGWRFGAGVRSAGKAKQKITIDGRPAEVAEFKADPAAVLEVGYALASNAWISGRYVKETYKLDSYSYDGRAYPVKPVEVDGSHLGLFAGFVF